MAAINNFDVLKRMSADNRDIRMGTDLVSANFSHKKGTQVTFGIGGDVTSALLHGRLVGCVLLWNPDQFAETKKKMEGGVTHART